MPIGAPGFMWIAAIVPNALSLEYSYFSGTPPMRQLQSKSMKLENVSNINSFLKVSSALITKKNRAG